MSKPLRINWGNGQVQVISSVKEGLKIIADDIYGEFASIQRLYCDEWETVSKRKAA